MTKWTFHKDNPHNICALSIQSALEVAHMKSETYFASSVKAIIPEAMGVAALVPPKERVHSPFKAVVVCVIRNEVNNYVHTMIKIWLLRWMIVQKD